MFDMMPFSRRSTSVYNPFSELEAMERAFFKNNDLAAFKTDIKDTGSAYELKTDLPGFKKEDLHLDLNGDTLTISAERHSEWENKDEQGSFIRCERSYGTYSRSFDVSGVDTQGIQASYTDGVLTLTLPKKTETVPTSRRLEIH